MTDKLGEAETLNQLYDLDLTFTLRNASPTDQNPAGTRVIVSFNMEKAIKAQNCPGLAVPV